MLTFTFFDYLVLGIMIFFTLLGLVRGLIRELTSLINWIGSGFLTVLLRPFLNELISQKITNEMISNIVSSFIIFTIAIIGFSILTSNIARAINTKFPSSVNVTMGLAFGFTKGFLISSLIFATILNLFGDTDDLSSKTGPKWLQNSETYRPLSFGAYIILPFADSIFGQIREKYKIPEKEDEDLLNSNSNFKEEKSENKLDKFKRYKDDFDGLNNMLDKVDKLKNKDTSKKISDDKQNNSDSKNEGGYKKEQVDKLNHLIDII